jgi:trans-aconitate methyltransferase
MTHHEPWTVDYLEEKFAKPDPWKYLTSPYEQTKYKRQIEVVKDRRLMPRRILEIGSAEGAHTQILAESFPSARITAVEISSRAIDRAREKLENYKDQVELANADIIEYESMIDDGSFDVCVWSESVYYVGARASLNDTYHLLEKIVGKLVPSGILVMANTVDLPKDIPESVITRRAIIDCYYQMLSSLATPVQKTTYFDEKFGRVYEYQIWAFFR